MTYNQSVWQTLSQLLMKIKIMMICLEILRNYLNLREKKGPPVDAKLQKILHHLIKGIFRKDMPTSIIKEHSSQKNLANLEPKKTNT